MLTHTIADEPRRPRTPARVTSIGTAIIAGMLWFGFITASQAVTLTTTSSCTCTPTLTKTCSTTTTTTAPNCKTYSSGTSSVKSTGKSLLPNLDLKCDFEGVAIEATPPVVDSTNPNLVIGGAAGAVVECREVLPGTDTTAIQEGSGDELRGLFRLRQSFTLDDCISYDESTGKRIWTCNANDIPPFVVAPPFGAAPPGCESAPCTGNTVYPDPNGFFVAPPNFTPIQWTLEPIGEDALRRFCRLDPSKAIDEGNPAIPFETCRATLGVPYRFFWESFAGQITSIEIKPNPVVEFVPPDFPAREIDGELVDAGVVLNFKAPDGVLKFGPCHSGRFDPNAFVSCFGQQINDAGEIVEVSTRSAGKVDAKLVIDVNMEDESLNMRNKGSSQSGFEVVFYGAPGFDVRNISINNISAIGPSGKQTLLTVKSFKYGYEEDPRTGSDRSVDGRHNEGGRKGPKTRDALLDLEVKFIVGSATAPNTFIKAVLPTFSTDRFSQYQQCKKKSTDVDVTFVGTFGAVPPYTGSWIASETGTADLRIFNCP